jgi:hypothetical protein
MLSPMSTAAGTYFQLSVIVSDQATTDTVRGWFTEALRLTSEHFHGEDAAGWVGNAWPNERSQEGGRSLWTQYARVLWESMQATEWATEFVRNLRAQAQAAQFPPSDAFFVRVPDYIAAEVAGKAAPSSASPAPFTTAPGTSAAAFLGAGS